MMRMHFFVLGKYIALLQGARINRKDSVESLLTVTTLKSTGKKLTKKQKTMTFTQM